MAAGEPVALRVGSFAVAPAHTPHAVVTIKNLRQVPYEGTLRVKGPEGWAIAPPEQRVSLTAGETKQVKFTVQRGTILKSNSYPLEVAVVGAGTSVVRRQNVATASAPFFKPTIDGRVDDWKDAIPVTFTTGGKKTTISTYWNRKQFCAMVAVEEDKLVTSPAGPDQGIDAVQIALAPAETKTGSSPDEAAGRYEFLLLAGAKPGEKAGCLLLADPDAKLAVTQKARALADLQPVQAELAVSRNAGTTYYECAIPFKLIPLLKPGEGREFCLSVLVHDPDGTGVRDWGEAAGLWPWERSPWAWSKWQGAKWGPEPPFDNRTPWGQCSSKY